MAKDPEEKAAETIASALEAHAKEMRAGMRGQMINIQTASAVRLIARDHITQIIITAGTISIYTDDARQALLVNTEPLRTHTIEVLRAYGFIFDDPKNWKTHPANEGPINTTPSE